MNLVFSSYVSSPEYTDPYAWLKRINAYTGILEALAETHTITAFERISYEGEVKQNGVTYYFVRFKTKVNRFPFHLHKKIKKLQPDIVFVNGFFPFQIIQLKLSVGRKTKIIILHRSEKPFHGWKKYLERLADKFIDTYFFASSEFGTEWSRAGNLSESKVHEVIQGSSVFHPADKQLARGKLSIAGSPIFIWVGRLDDNKDPLTVAKTFVQFLSKCGTAKLYMIYQSEELLSELKKIISISNTDSIYLVGKIANEKLQDWYSSSDFIISSSHYEGNGIAVCEGMSCGCIPILSNIISFRRMNDGKCGLLFEPGNENDLLSCLQSALQLDINAERKKVLDHFNNKLSFTAIAEKINRIIQE